ncbi:hypothetical protein PCANB_000625 [Pneumocystis canis]|nr:hypothetical protein PCK1_000729 [Pneumocystis canis]KAG5437590.1 hypothetical protein PCANB_000625 [Pneumocystis canis]
MRPKSVSNAISEAQPAALHAARLAMLKQLHLHLPIDESKIWNDDAQTDVISMRSVDQRSIVTSIAGFGSISDGHYHIPKKKMSVPLFFHENKEYPRFQTLNKTKFSTFSLRSSSKKKSAAGRFVLHLKRTLSNKNFLFQRPSSFTSQCRENLPSSLFDLKDLSKQRQVSPLTSYGTNTLPNANQPLSKKMDENKEFFQLKKKIAALEILETQNGKENKPLSEDKNNSLTILSEENNNDNFLLTTIENGSIIPSSRIPCNISLGSIDHRDNAGPIRLTNDLSPTPKLNYDLYKPYHASLYNQDTEIANSQTLVYHYRRNPPPVPTQSHLSPTLYNTPCSKIREVLYSKSYYNIRSPSGLEKAVNFNYGSIDEWRKEIRNSMHLEKRKDEKDASLFF